VGTYLRDCSIVAECDFRYTLIHFQYIDGDYPQDPLNVALEMSIIHNMIYRCTGFTVIY